ncbi:hypothetical protein CPG38_01880 [Malaciobacter marinus]|uniref:hypothetical protein n=1 Tax=Malaciobacter marinus TaxID=505249 RepID=UPI000C080692|nr:hypothetical protein [Malaciobacter marinus]PHO13477.1 hypothetical protein CPG38_01880 [Malaciobacter marinus]
MITKKLDDKIKLTAKTVNVQIGQEVKVILKLYDENKKVLKQKEYKEKVQENKKVEKRFTISNLADELNIDSSKVKYVSGWIDADNDGEITREYEKEVWIEVENIVFIGFIHRPNTNKVHLLTSKDIQKYKIQKRNPITKGFENIHPMFQGSASIFAGLYGFGDWAARISGFRDWQLDNIDNIEQKNSSKETEYTLRLIKHIISNNQGAGEIFLKVASKYIKSNPGYVTSRFITGVGLSYLSKAPLVIPSSATAGDVLFTAKEIDDFAKNIILGK